MKLTLEMTPATPPPAPPREDTKPPMLYKQVSVKLNLGNGNAWRRRLPAAE